MPRYIPQVVLNYQRKSTEGWNISNSLTDIAGGVFSIMQQCVDAYALKVKTLQVHLGQHGCRQELYLSSAPDGTPRNLPCAASRTDVACVYACQDWSILTGA